MIELEWENVRSLGVANVPAGPALKIGDRVYMPDASLDFGAPLGSVKVANLQEVCEPPTWDFNPQLAALVFLITHNPYALHGYFPITKSLDKAGLKDFYQLIQAIIRNRHFDLRLFDLVYRGVPLVLDITKQIPAHVVWLVAGHLAEVFFYRRDILERLLSTPRGFWLYTTPEAFKRDGGAAGGNYRADKGCIQLVLARLYEGFYDRTPGVAPFLHEFGHMLDHFDAQRGAKGLLPGLHPDDGDIFTANARERFLKGKQLELKRYLLLHRGVYQPGAPLPIGHPYVFQNDGEFIAGYFEMFFRNPHYFAAQNPDLYEGFALLFKQDPRQFWAADFPFYIQQNEDFYRSGQHPPKPGITV